MGPVPTAIARPPVQVLPDWFAGEYEQKSTDTGQALELENDGSYRWSYSGFIGRASSREERGRVRLVDGWLVFEPTGDTEPAAHEPLSKRGCVVAQDSWRCFLLEREIVSFCNGVNAGHRPSPGFMLATEASSATEPELAAQLPPEFAGYVLSGSVVATVREVEDLRAAGESGDRVEFTIDAGSTEGLRAGMELWPLDLPSWDKTPWPGRLVEVTEHSAKGRMRWTNSVPAVGTRMSTRDPRAK
ncbi:MAG: hypothetical protein K8S98_18960 [Planctomycetes bacterium]|nr:hypothetical protein [Planctomycetota bacterium]